jgi:hypothetical protein
VVVGWHFRCVFLAFTLTMVGAVLILFVESNDLGGVRDRYRDPETKQWQYFDGCDGEIEKLKFASLIRCIYWAAMTVTTVGYGDMHPCTPMGQVGFFFFLIRWRCMY